MRANQDLQCRHAKLLFLADVQIERSSKYRREEQAARGQLRPGIYKFVWHLREN